MPEASLQTYADGGVTQFKSWLPDLPPSWKIAPFSSVGSIHARIGWRGLTADEYVDEGYAFLSTPDILQDEIDFESVNRIPEWRYEESPDIKLRQDDVLLSKDGTLGVVRLIRELPEPATVNSSIAVLRTSPELIPDFLAWYLQSTPIQQFIGLKTAGATVPHLFQKDIKDFRVLLPPRDVQKQIPEYLDYHTARIDQLIEKKQRLLELLEEKRQAVITRATTKGLDPDVEMKGSGVEWIGEIPTHWRTARIKHISRVIDSKHRTPEYVEDGVPIVSPTEIEPGRLSLEGAKYTTVDEHRDLSEGGRDPRRGDIIYSRNASVGAAGLVDTDESFTLGQDLCIIRPGESGVFLHYVLNSSVGGAQVEAKMIGATFNRINVSTIKDLWVTAPPAREQDAIANYLDTMAKRSRELEAKVRKGIDLLSEKRQALITAAVTGQIDVTDWQPPTKEATPA